MRRKIAILTLLGLMLGCEQVPSSLDEEAFIEENPEVTFSLSVDYFDFDYFTRSFFSTATATSPHDDLQVTAQLFTGDSLVAELSLNDSGTGSDIQAGDHSYDMNWIMPESLLNELSNSWKLMITAESQGAVLGDSTELNPSIPQAPAIEHVAHQDTLHLPTSGLVFDTLRVTVSHPDGLDEIRDVGFRSLKPNGEYASSGNQIPLLDDGGAVVLYEYFGVKITSGDTQAGDGIFSLTLPLSASDLTGTYIWTFTARSWEGLISEVFEDSLVVMTGSGVPQ